HSSCISAQHRSAIESEPAQKEQKDANRRQRHAVTEDRLDLAVLRILPLTRTQNDHRSQRREPAERMHETRAGEIREAHVVKPTVTPLPRAGDRIKESDDYGSGNHEAAELDPLGDRPRD